jgi:phosphoglycerate dehydrogenase-like enzyme
MNIVVCQPAAARGKFQLERPLRDLAREHNVWLNPRESGDAELDEMRDALDMADALVCGWGCGPLQPEVYAAAPRLRLAALIGSSIKPLAPEAAWDRSIVITNTASAVAEGVAEYVLGAMLLWLHKYDGYDRRMKAGEAWATAKTAYWQRNVCDTTIGLVGCGLVGEMLGMHLRSLGARLLAYDPYLRPAVLEEQGFEPVATIENLLQRSDIVSLHAGATPETDGMIGARQLAAMRDGALLVNSARGTIMDEQALLAELRTGRIDAFLDVFQEEPLPAQHPFRRLENVHLAPHAAASSNLTVLKRAAEHTCANLRRLARGEPLQHVVTPAMFARMT